MKNASGHHRDEARWPFLPLAAPRGARELLWHVGVLLAVVSPLVPPVGFAVFAEVIALTWLLEMRPADLMKLSAEFALLGVLIATQLRELTREERSQLVKEGQQREHRHGQRHDQMPLR